MEFIKTNGTSLEVGSETFQFRGFGLGGWFLPEGYMWKMEQHYDRPRKLEQLIIELCGEKYAASFWEFYENNFITEKDIQWIAKERFNSIRLPLNARHLFSENADSYILDQRRFEKIDQVIEWCRKYHIYVIIDMHAAPGGQTGENIDDSENNEPSLFLHDEFVEPLIWLWTEIAKRYKNDDIVAGYDLLNEPLSNRFDYLQNRVMPVYRKLIASIRSFDDHHLIILEGTHWATDFSIFEELTPSEIKSFGPIMLEFHKYWNNPDKESLEKYIKLSKKFNIPLYMGESGENNCEWYTTLFPLCDQLKISWSFWTYKKMDCNNSPKSFPKPTEWDKIQNYLQNKSSPKPSQTESIQIFNNFLNNILIDHKNQNVIRALKREIPILIPCEAYDWHQIKSNRHNGAILREKDPVTIILSNGKIKQPDYRQMAGEPRPKDEETWVILSDGDEIGYNFFSKFSKILIIVDVRGKGKISIRLEGNDDNLIFQINNRRKFIKTKFSVYQNSNNRVILSCILGEVKFHSIELQPIFS